MRYPICMEMKPLEKPRWAIAIQSRRDSMNVSQERLALEMDVSPSLITKIERGAHDFRKMTVRNFEALLNALNWNISDFERETGASFEALGTASHSREDSASLVGFHLVPIIGVAEAGFPETYPVPNRLKRPGTRVFQVHGESMNGGNKPIQDGDHLLVDVNQTDLQEGKVFVIEIIGNGHCVKRARNRKGEWWLESDNTEFASYAPEEAVIFGRVYYKMSGDDL
jgi:SOS-response transcriptional repressor LexA